MPESTKLTAMAVDPKKKNASYAFTCAILASMASIILGYGTRSTIVFTSSQKKKKKNLQMWSEFVFRSVVYCQRALTVQVRAKILQTSG
jgi:hypothetical protein